MNASLLVLLPAVIWANPGFAATAPESATEPGNAPLSTAEHTAHHGHGRRSPKRVLLGDTRGAKVTFWQPDLETRPLTAQDQAVTLPRTGIAAYYAVVAEWDRPATKEVLIRYEYMHGRPTDHSPRELLAAVKTDLEIVPDPIPREHYRYHANERWGFRARFKGDLLAGAVVLLSTEHGHQQEGITDAAGRVSFVLPDDFPEVHPGRDANTPAEMTLWVEYSEEDQRYTTRLAAAYHADPSHWQSVPWGAGVAALGLLAGLVGTLRGRNGKNRTGK